jgi:hypothetical protein
MLTRFPTLELLQVVDQLGRYLGAQVLWNDRKADALKGLRRLQSISDTFPLPKARARVNAILERETQSAIVPTALQALVGQVLHELGEDVVEWWPVAIPYKKMGLLTSNWLENTTLRSKSPRVMDELRTAAHCLVFGESTACVFHLMRVMDFAAKLIARSLSIADAERLMWGDIAQAIERELRKRHGDKDWRAAEPFYARAMVAILSFSTGYRSPAMHDVNEIYNEEKAQYLLTIVREFIFTLAEAFDSFSDPKLVKP